MINYFWGAGLFLLSVFLIPKFPADPRVIRDFLFFALAMISVCFGIKKSNPIVLLIILAFSINVNYNQVGWLYQFPMFCAGIVLFVQFHSNPFSEKFFKYSLGLLGLVSTAWAICNYFGVEPYHIVKSQWFKINPKVIMSGPLLNHTLSSVYPALALVFMPWYLKIIMFIGLGLYSSTMSLLAGVLS